MSEIVAVIASPRKNGNTDTIVKEMAKAAEENGNKVRFFYLNELRNMRGCQACKACKKGGHCIQKDDTAEILEAIEECDGLILSAPVYFGRADARYLLLEDRFYSFFGVDGAFNIPAGKKVAVVSTCGGHGAEEVADTIANRMVRLQFELIGKISLMDKGEKSAAANDEAILAQAKEIGSKF